MDTTTNVLNNVTIAAEEVVEAPASTVVATPETAAPAAAPATPPVANPTPADSNIIGQGVDKKAHLDWTPVPFKSFGNMTRVKSNELAKDIHYAFARTFHEVVGANITYGGGNFNVELYFEYNKTPCPDGKITNIVNLSNPAEAKNSELLTKVSILQNRQNNRVYTLNDETKLLLSDFMYGGRAAMPYNSGKWSQCIKQIALPVSSYNDPIYNRGDRILICVTGLNIHTIVQRLFGREMVTSTLKGSDNTYTNITADAYYEVRYARPWVGTTFIMNIEQFDYKAVQEYLTEENPQMMQTSGIVYY